MFDELGKGKHLNHTMCFIMKGGSSSVTRLNDDTGLRHPRPEPVANDNIYKMDEEQSALRMKTLTSGAVHAQIVPVTDAN